MGLDLWLCSLVLTEQWNTWSHFKGTILENAHEKELPIFAFLDGDRSQVWSSLLCCSYVGLARSTRPQSCFDFVHWEYPRIPVIFVIPGPPLPGLVWAADLTFGKGLVQTQSRHCPSQDVCASTGNLPCCLPIVYMAHGIFSVLVIRYMLKEVMALH